MPEKWSFSSAYIAMSLYRKATCSLSTKELESKRVSIHAFSSLWVFDDTILLYCNARRWGTQSARLARAARPRCCSWSSGRFAANVRAGAAGAGGAAALWRCRCRSPPQAAGTAAPWCAPAAPCPCRTPAPRPPRPPASPAPTATRRRRSGGTSSSSTTTSTSSRLKSLPSSILQMP